MWNVVLILNLSRLPFKILEDPLSLTFSVFSSKFFPPVLTSSHQNAAKFIFKKPQEVFS